MKTPQKPRIEHRTGGSTLWPTPPVLFRRIEKEIKSEFIFDAAALPESTKVPGYFATPHGVFKDGELISEKDAMSYDWPLDGWVWVNPPYGPEENKEWAKLIIRQSQRGVRIAALTGASPGVNWFYDLFQEASGVIFIKGRVRFVGAKYSAGFDSAVLLMNEEAPEEKVRYLVLSPKERGL